MAMRLWVYCPLVSTPETICTDDDWGLGRGGQDGVDVGT